MKKLIGKVILITGASGGLGEKIALHAANQGATIIGVSRRKDRLEKVITQCKELSQTEAYAFELDVADKNQVTEVLTNILQITPKIDYLINNAGFGVMENFVDLDMNRVEEMFKVNVLGLMQIAQIIAKKMKAQGSGEIVNIASMAGKIATPKASAYAATKFAVIGFSNALRLELASSSINVMTVNPGPMQTEFFTHAGQDNAYLKSLGKVVLDPDKLAKRIVRNLGSKKREINAPWYMQIASVAYAIFPKLGDYLTGGVFNKK